MKYFRISTFIFSLLFFTVTFSSPPPIFAQSACACSNSVCSANQSCPSGYIAVCTCEATGCSSECKKESGGIIIPELPTENLIAQKLRETSVNSFAKVLSESFGKSISFEPTTDEFRFNYVSSKLVETSHWDILEYLDRNGELKINGHSVDFWKNRRNTLINGGEFAFCTSSISVNMLLREITFITGKRFSIISGDGNQKITGTIRGNILSEVIENLSKAGGVTIIEK